MKPRHTQDREWSDCEIIEYSKRTLECLCGLKQFTALYRFVERIICQNWCENVLLNEILREKFDNDSLLRIPMVLVIVFSDRKLYG
jgi:hypothetical protein